MNHRNKVWGFGVVLLGIAAACTPGIRELGDEPVGGAGSGGTGSGGTGSERAGTAAALPNGGSQTQNQPTAGEPSAGGSGPESDCFGPHRRLDLAQDPDALGCPCNGADTACVRDDSGEVLWLGQLDCVDGRWKSVPPSCDQDCYSPTNRPDLALYPGSLGCACDAEPPECVLTEYEGEPWRVSLYCEEGQWVSAEDGVCGDGQQADCRVDGVTYPHGARRLRSPFSACTTCSCDDGELVDCTVGDCADQPCPDGSFEAKRCAECGPADGCAVMEHGCFTDPSCEDGVCEATGCP